MAKNILLLFLSPVKTVKVEGKVNISEADYKNIAGEKTKTTNESAVRYLLQKNISLDKIFILASKKVRQPISSEEPQSHLEFFIARLEKFLPGVDCSIYKYDEKKSGDESLKDVAEMARLIQNFAAGEKVNLHVDLTGGMRHISLIMLELTRLLEYSGLKVGSVLYSNYDVETKIGNVEELKNIYDLFQLIAGVEEFVNFGSVKALKIYYVDKKIPEPLKKLLDAMENFADAVKLCHYGQFRQAIEDLHDNLRYFEENLSDDVQDTLMAKLIGRIRKDYHDLISNRKRDDLEIIRWCLEHDYIQQALTLYTERIPEYLGEKKILAQSEAKEKFLTDAVKNDDMGRNRYFYLFSEIIPQKNYLEKALVKYQRSLKIDAWVAIRKKKFDFDAWADKLDESLSEQKISVKNEARFRSQLETLAKIIQEPKLLLDLKLPELEPLNKLFAELSAELEQVEHGFERRKIIINFMTVAPVTTLAKIFDGARFVMLMNKYPHARKIHELLVEKIFNINIPEEKFLSIVEKYFLIKNERNNINHAHEKFGEFTTTKSLRKFILTAVEEVKENLPAD